MIDKEVMDRIIALEEQVALLLADRAELRGDTILDNGNGDLAEVVKPGRKKKV